jgi:DNA-binding transcriptional LysR family regulator
MVEDRRVFELTESIEEAERLFMEDFDTWVMAGYYLYSKYWRAGVSGHIGTGGFGVMSPLTWRLGDLFAKHAFLLKGLGWGGMPSHAVKRDLSEGRLMKLSIEDLPEEGLILPMSAVYLTAQPPGPAGRWLIERLKQCQSARH